MLWELKTDENISNFIKLETFNDSTQYTVDTGGVYKHCFDNVSHVGTVV